MSREHVGVIANSPLFQKELQALEERITNAIADPVRYLRSKSLKAAKKLVDLMETSESERIQQISALEILDRAGAPKITRLEGDKQPSVYFDNRVVKLLLVSKLEAGLIPEDQREEALQQLAELESGEDGNGNGKAEDREAD